MGGGVMDDFDLRARRRANRERDQAESDARDQQVIAMDAEIAEAMRFADQLPAPLGEAIVELFVALKPSRMDDGYLSWPVKGEHSPEMMKLVRAVKASLREVLDVGPAEFVTQPQQDHSHDE